MSCFFVIPQDTRRDFLRHRLCKYIFYLQNGNLFLVCLEMFPFVPLWQTNLRGLSKMSRMSTNQWSPGWNKERLKLEFFHNSATYRTMWYKPNQIARQACVFLSSLNVGPVWRFNSCRSILPDKNKCGALLVRLQIDFNLALWKYFPGSVRVT